MGHPWHQPPWEVVMRRILASLSVVLALPFAVVGAGEPSHDYPIRPVPFTSVALEDDFWAPRLSTNRRVTIPHDLDKCDETGRIQNFAVAGGLAEGVFRGRFGFDDSDVFKVLEGAAYSVGSSPDPVLEARTDEIIAKIAAAQEDDGYLYTAGTIEGYADEPICCFSRPRWSNLRSGHELYNLGHLYEAAVAHHQATGKRTLLDVARRSADLLTATFGPGLRPGVPGHQEVEVGLVRLYRVTGEKRYLDLARHFLDQRGRPEGRELYGAYNQDHLPVVEQHEAVGHAVRATYMYSAMADVGALTEDPGYVAAIDRLWEDVVGRKLYLTGGIGARHEGESFGDAYELPNRDAYAETCAAIANAMWNHRLFLQHGDAKYLDVLERVIYNGVLAGVSLDGDHFFYPNPLASDGSWGFNQGATVRRPWFDCSCCPTNVARFLPSIPGYVYAQRGRELFVNLFATGRAQIEIEGESLLVRQETRYPWDGSVLITLTPDRPLELTLHVRVPGWARGQPVPSDLYRYLDAGEGSFGLCVNGQPVEAPVGRGFVTLRRSWSPGDTVALTLPMPIRRVASHEAVLANAGRIALERGPIVYCVEGGDHGGRVFNLVVPDDARLAAERRDDLLGGVSVITGRVPALVEGADGRSVVTREQPFLAVPYYAWAHRGAGEMAVWLPRRVRLDFRIP
jgi:uncharacterized protein